MTLLHDFHRGQKRFKHADFQKLGRAAKQILNMSVGRGLNRIETRFGSAIWPTRQKKPDVAPAASGAVQAFFFAVGDGVYDMDAWRCVSVDAIAPTADGNPTTGGSVWIAKPPILRGTGIHNLPFQAPDGSGAWYRYEFQPNTFEVRNLYRGTTSASQTTLVRTEGLNPFIFGGSFNLPSPQSESYRWFNKMQKLVIAMNIDAGFQKGGEPVKWIDLNIQARHWVRTATFGGDLPTEDYTGRF